MHAEHAANGLLSSGATLKRAAKLWEERTEAALDDTLAEFGALIVVRGREWRRAMAAARTALELHYAAVERDLAPTFHVARPPGGEAGAAMVAIRSILDEAGYRLRQRAAAFEEGWTAPRPETWIARHPVIYGLLSAGAGALIGEAIKRVSSILG
jgi:hypothetical protein